MSEKNKLRLKLKDLLSEKRYQHSLGVEKVAVDLAKTYNVPLEQAALAGLLHDFAKGLGNDLLLKKAYEFDILVGDVEQRAPYLLHGPVGARMVQRELGITDQGVLQAIALHTTGAKEMTLLDKIIYLADYIEPARIFPGVEEIRKLSFMDLDKALLLATDSTLAYLLKRRALIHGQTIEFRNSLLINGGG